MPGSPIDVSEQAGVRYLHFGSAWVQGAMRIARPWSLELEYTREMMATLLLRPAPDFPRRALLIGLGAGSLAKFLYRHFPQAHLTVVEINPDVVPVARFHFRLPQDDARLCISIADGTCFVTATAERFDLILVDGFDHRARPGGLDATAFYAACRQCLTPDGVLATNLFAERRGYAAHVARLREAFEGRIIALPPCDSGNAIVFGVVGSPVDMDFDEVAKAAAALKAATGLNLKAMLQRLARAGMGLKA